MIIFSNEANFLFTSSFNLLTKLLSFLLVSFLELIFLKSFSKLLIFDSKSFITFSRSANLLFNSSLLFPFSFSSLLLFIFNKASLFCFIFSYTPFISSLIDLKLFSPLFLLFSISFLIFSICSSIVFKFVLNSFNSSWFPFSTTLVSISSLLVLVLDINFSFSFLDKLFISSISFLLFFSICSFTALLILFICSLKLLTLLFISFIFPS